MVKDYNSLKHHRFDPPGGWRWSCRFLLEELKEIYLKLFDYNWFELNPDRVFKTIENYHVGKDATYGEVKLEDGGMKRLESCTVEELDWYLFIGESFLLNDSAISWKDNFDSQISNPLYKKLDRDSALISLDLNGYFVESLFRRDKEVHNEKSLLLRY